MISSLGISRNAFEVLLAQPSHIRNNVFSILRTIFTWDYAEFLSPERNDNAEQMGVLDYIWMRVDEVVLEFTGWPLRREVELSAVTLLGDHDPDNHDPATPRRMPALAAGDSAAFLEVVGKIRLVQDADGEIRPSTEVIAAWKRYLASRPSISLGQRRVLECLTALCRSAQPVDDISAWKIDRFPVPPSIDIVRRIMSCPRVGRAGQWAPVRDYLGAAGRLSAAGTRPDRDDPDKAD